MEIRLTPSGNLRWDVPEGKDADGSLHALRESFQEDWREGLFLLAAEKARVDAYPSVRYWQALAERYLTALCHLPETVVTVAVGAPDATDWATLLLTAPPMTGGEYLSETVLAGVWAGLEGWTQEAAAKAGGLAPLLRKRAAKWQQVGRVCFHLAENKRDEGRPFAFMATYTSGLGTDGQLRHLPLRKALEQYAGAKNKSALINLLSPVYQAAERCAWVKTMIESGEIYQPMAWTPERAYTLLQSVPQLEEGGLTVRIPNWWKKRPKPRVAVTVGQQSQGAMGLDALLDFDVRVALGDESLSQEEINALLAGEEGLVLVKGQWVEVNRARLQEAIDHWEALQERARKGEISLIEGMRLLAGAPEDLTDGAAEVEQEWVHLEAGGALREALDGLRNPERLKALEPGKEFTATLRPYQREGFAWLDLLTGLGLGACLADDMGLGKTVQVLALLAFRRNTSKQGARTRSLLVVPASLLGNWKREAERFAPALKVLYLHPSEAGQAAIDQAAKAPEKALRDYDLVVTTYSLLTRIAWLHALSWDLAILDEAQAVKNPGTRQSKAVRNLDARARIAMTGTPVENRLGDLWALFDFLNPGLLGSTTVFKNFVKRLQARETQQYAPLRQLVGPYILRRLKTDRSIISDLPDKTEVLRFCNLGKSQLRLYGQTVDELRAKLEGADGIERRGLVLQSLMRLKQICNHPSQFTGDKEYATVDSGKFLQLAEICEELAERQEKVLIFTQFREIIPPLADHLAGVFGRQGLVLHGETGVKKRSGLVEEFQREDGPPFFLLSLKAGGTGLTLTAASHVIHFDRWWNPAVENQATDRAYRIGQKRNVLVHKFVTTGTLEERIDRLIEGKKKLAEDVLGGDAEVKLTELADDELLDLVRLDVNRAAL